MKDDLISITELAKLRNVTTETLRHYDRIGLFKPVYIDPETKYRYYSIMQYEKLGTIKELRQLGMSLDHIKDYFEDRNVHKSIKILTRHHRMLKDKIKELTLLEKTLSNKLDFLNNITNTPQDTGVRLVKFPERHLITFGEVAADTIDVNLSYTKLENLLNEVAPILATNRMGAIISKEFLSSDAEVFKMTPMIVCDSSSTLPDKYTRVVPAGYFACIYHNGTLTQKSPELDKLPEFIEKNGFEIRGDILRVKEIDITVTDNYNESMTDMQVPIRKKS